MVRREEVQPDVGRVTAGIPSLDSPIRFQQDSDLVRKDYAQQIEADIQAKEASSIAPDGEKSRTILDASKGKQITAAEMIRRLSALNGNLWFERSKAAPSEMGVYLKIPVTLDSPEGLKYIGGFSAERPLNERDWIHTKQRTMYVTDSSDARRVIGTKIVSVQCHGCKDCAKRGAIGGVIRGYRMLLKRLEDARVITPTQTEKMFGSGESKNWQARHGA